MAGRNNDAATYAKRVAALERLRELVQLLPAFSPPESAVEAYGSIRAEPELKGEMIVSNNNLWIAVHALVAGLTLVTNDETEFRRFAG